MSVLVPLDELRRRISLAALVGRRISLARRGREFVALFGRDLSCEDARQIVENVTGFFAILTEWSRVEIPIPANDRTKPATSECRRSAR